MAADGRIFFQDKKLIVAIAVNGGGAHDAAPVARENTIGTSAALRIKNRQAPDSLGLPDTNANLVLAVPIQIRDAHCWVISWFLGLRGTMPCPPTRPIAAIERFDDTMIFRLIGDHNLRTAISVEVAGAENRGPSVGV